MPRIAWRVVAGQEIKKFPKRVGVSRYSASDGSRNCVKWIEKRSETWRPIGEAETQRRLGAAWLLALARCADLKHSQPVCLAPLGSPYAVVGLLERTAPEPNLPAYS